MENFALQMEKSPPSTPEAEKRTPSPTTSTPEQQEVQRAKGPDAVGEDTPGRFRQSDLAESDESAINDSLWDVNNATRQEDPEEDSTILGTDPKGSCIANRTRARSSLSDHDNSMIFDLSSIVKAMKNLEETDKDMTGDEEGHSILETPQSIPLEWINETAEREKMKNTLTEIEKSVELEEKEKEKKENNNKNLEKFLDLSKVVLDKARQISVPDMTPSEEYQKLGGITFSLSKPAYEANDVMSNALKLLAMVDLRKLPKYNLENIIRLLIAMCMDGYRKLSISNEIIDNLEKNLGELYTSNEKLLAIEKCRIQLEVEVDKATRKYNELCQENTDLNQGMIRLTEYAKEKLQTQTISDLNQEKENVMIYLRAAEANLGVAKANEKNYKDKEYSARAKATELELELAETKEDLDKKVMN